MARTIDRRDGRNDGRRHIHGSSVPGMAGNLRRMTDSRRRSGMARSQRGITRGYTGETDRRPS